MHYTLIKTYQIKMVLLKNDILLLLPIRGVFMGGKRGIYDLL